jgi:transcriptional regulator with XRE-family HTH domain
MLRRAARLRNSLQGIAWHHPVRYKGRVAVGIQRSEFAGALREWRRRRRVSQLELAIDAGTTQRHIEQLVPERGRPTANHLGYAVPLRLRSPDGELTLLTTLAHFATAIDVTVSELSREAFLPGDAATAKALAVADRGGRPVER